MITAQIFGCIILSRYLKFNKSLKFYKKFYMALFIKGKKLKTFKIFGGISQSEEAAIKQLYIQLYFGIPLPLQLHFFFVLFLELSKFLPDKILSQCWVLFSVPFSQLQTPKLFRPNEIYFCVT